MVGARQQNRCLHRARHRRHRVRRPRRRHSRADVTLGPREWGGRLEEWLRRWHGPEAIARRLPGHVDCPRGRTLPGPRPRQRGGQPDALEQRAERHEPQLRSAVPDDHQAWLDEDRLKEPGVPPKPPRDDFRLNEPKPTIPGGTRRASVRIDRGRIPEIARRERLNRLLLAHDPEVAEKNRARITDRDLELLRRIAQEGALAGTPPALRRNAIAYLADRPTPENVNLLVDLARHGEDFYVRGAALAALGRTGLRAVAPILADGLVAQEPVEAAS